MKNRIYVDGACSGNPGPGAWAICFLTKDGKIERTGFDEDTTNNRMELMAVIEAVMLAKANQLYEVDIYSDSAYVINAIKQDWIKRWEFNAWKKRDGEPVANKDLWMKFRRETHPRNRPVAHYTFIKIKGHSGVKHNERVDLLAKEACQNGMQRMKDEEECEYEAD